MLISVRYLRCGWQEGRGSQGQADRRLLLEKMSTPDLRDIPPLPTPSYTCNPHIWSIWQQQVLFVDIKRPCFSLIHEFNRIKIKLNQLYKKIKHFSLV